MTVTWMITAVDGTRLDCAMPNDVSNTSTAANHGAGNDSGMRIDGEITTNSDYK
jgi:hypothetical protein